MQSVPGLGATPSTVCFLWQKHRKTEDPEKLSNKVKTNLCRNPLLLYFSKSLRGMLGHPRNARTSEMVQKCKATERHEAVGSKCVWKRLIFPSVLHSRGRTSRGFDQGPFYQPREKSQCLKGDEDALGEIKVSEKESGHSNDVTAAEVTGD